MTNDALPRLPPPPLFTLRPPPKPPGSFFERFQAVEILNGQCVIPSIHTLPNSTSFLLEKHQQQINWLNLFLLILALISVISCVIIAVFIFICLKKLKTEEKQYKNYVTTGSLARHAHQFDLCARSNEHYKGEDKCSLARSPHAVRSFECHSIMEAHCTPTTLNCCDDYYSHQLIPLTEPPVPPVPLPSSVLSPHPIKNSIHNIDSSSLVSNLDGRDSLQNHQYECIPEYLLTMTRRHRHAPLACHYPQSLYHRPSTCSLPYATFSRSLIHSQAATNASTSDSSQCTCSPPPSTTLMQEESATPLLASSTQKESQRQEETFVSSPRSLRTGWTRRSGSTSARRKSTDTNVNEQRYSFLSQLRKSAVLQ